jgi:hypothetical protein
VASHAQAQRLSGGATAGMAQRCTVAVVVLLLTGGATTATAPGSPFRAEFGEPVLVGSSDLTHFWFPASTMRVQGGVNSTVFQGISRSGDGRSCPPPGHPSYPCSATLDSRDGGLTYEVAPPSGPFPLLPERPSDPKSTKAPTNFSSLNAFKCVNASCTGQLVRWQVNHSTTPSLPGVKLQPTAYLPLRVTAVTPQLLSAEDAERPIMLRDGSILIATYGFAADSLRDCSKEMPQNRCYTIFFFMARDPVTAPLDWEYVSRIDYIPAMSEEAGGATGHIFQGNVAGPCEPAVVQLPGQDDRLLSVFRIQSYTGHWAALSETSGRSWGTPFPTGTWAVSPNLLVLNNGAVVLTSGRPGIGLWLASFAGHHGVGHDGLPSWEFHNVIAEHNQRMPLAALQYPCADAAVQNVSSHDFSYIVNAANPHGSPSALHASTTAYTGLLALDNKTLLLSYDRLASGWAGPPGRLGDADHVFSMRVTIEEALQRY